MTAPTTVERPWWAGAACLNVDPNLFHPAKGETQKPAKAVCASCVVRCECLDWALRNHETRGIWGGTSERERRQLRRRQPELWDEPIMGRAVETVPVRRAL